MPNTANFNNRYRTNQLIKVEKENENLEVKNRMKNITREPLQRKETVWDRLSKARKTPSSENVSIIRSRPNVATKPSHRFQIMKQMAAHHQQQQQQLLYQQQQQQVPEHMQHSPRRPLTPNSASNRHRSSRKYHLQKAIIMPEVDNEGFVYVCKPVKSVREIVTARSLNPSKSSIEDNRNPDNQIIKNVSQVETPSMTAISTNNIIEDRSPSDSDQSDVSSDDFRLAPLMSSRSHYDLLNNSSAKIVSHFQEVLRRRKQDFLEPDELEMVKNVIKSDKRYHDLDKSDPKLFKEILKTQLQDILKHEHAVKQALHKLDSSENVSAGHQMRSIATKNELVAYERQFSASQKLEVDVVFKNVPTLEKEIIILRALGEKLDATLKCSTSQRSLHSRPQDVTHGKTVPTNTKFLLIEIKLRSFIYATESHAFSYVAAKGICLTSGVAQEFRIAQKTIVELKEDANRSFYIPINPETSELKKTSFKKLKQNPDILMRHLKAKNAAIPFNVLDHDPVFFNNIFFNKSHKVADNVCDTPTQVGPSNKEQPTLCEGGDSRQFYEVEVKEENQNDIAKTDGNVKDQSIELMEPTKKKYVHRKRVRKSVTPLPFGKEISPKNNLLKTVLVGSVQLSCFMLLIVAFTFPEAKC